MSNVVSFDEEARKQCIQLGQRIGESMAKRIMATVILHNFGVDELDQMVEGTMDLARRDFRESGMNERDIEVMSSIIYEALVKKGKEISMSWNEEGHA